MIRIIAVLVLFSTSAMAGQIQIHKGKVEQEVTVLGDSESKRMVKAPNAPSAVIANSKRWPCGGFAGIAGQGQYVGGNIGFTTDSKNCVAWMLAMQEPDIELREAYKCQMKVHRKAMASIGKPCVTTYKPIPRPVYRD